MFPLLSIEVLFVSKEQSYLQLQRPVHAKFPLTHLKHPLHTFLHQQWMTSLPV